MINTKLQYQVAQELPHVHELLSQIVTNVAVVPGGTAVMFVTPPEHYRFMVVPAASVLDLTTLMVDFHNEGQPTADEYAFSLQAKQEGDLVLHGRGTLHLEQVEQADVHGTQLTLTFSGALEPAYIHLSPDFVATQLRAMARQLFENVFDRSVSTPPVEQTHQLNRVGAIMLGALLVYLFMRWINKKNK